MRSSSMVGRSGVIALMTDEQQEGTDAAEDVGRDDRDELLHHHARVSVEEPAVEAERQGRDRRVHVLGREHAGQERAERAADHVHADDVERVVVAEASASG